MAKIRIGDKVFHRKRGDIGYVENRNKTMFRVCLGFRSVWCTKDNTGKVKIGQPAQATGHKRLPIEKML